MYKKICLLLLLSLTFTTSLMASGVEAVKGKVKDSYNYWFYAPGDVKELRKGEAKPLVIFLHGASLCGTDMNKVRRYGTINAIEKGRDLDAYVIAPQNPGGAWKPEKIMKIVDYVSEHNNVDPNRIYVLGMSLGGYGTLDLTAAYPDRIAAAIGICGGSTAKDMSGLAEVPLWIIHGTADNAVSISQSDKVAAAVRNAQKDGVNRLSYDRVAGMNHSQPARILYNPDTYEWLFSHRLDTEGRPMTPTKKINSDYMGSSYSGLDHSKGYKSKSAKSGKSKKAAKNKKNKKSKKKK